MSKPAARILWVEDNIGEKLDLTRERIRQLQHSALTRLYECMNQD